MKKFLSTLTALALCMTLLPATVWAVDVGTHIPGLGIGSTPQSELYADIYYLIDDNGTPTTTDASENNYNIYYDSSTNTLTLNNAKLNKALFVPGGTTIYLVGENVFGSEDSTVSVGIQITSTATGDTALTVKGDEDSSLTIWCLNEGITDGVDSDKNISIEGGIIRITNTQSSPIYSRNGSITISGNANVTANSGNSSISCKKDLTITGNAVVNVTNRASALSSSAKIVISGNAQVTATSTVACPLEGSDGIEILDNASVTATGETGALNSFYGYILIEGKATATLTGQPVPVGGGMSGSAAVSVGTNAAPTAARSITVKGELTVNSTFVGIWTSGTGDITIDGGEVSITTPYYGIMTRMATSADATGGNVTIQNKGTLTITGAARGLYPYASNCTLTVDDSTVDTTTSAWGLYWRGPIVLKNSTVTCADTGTSNSAISASSITYEYSDSYKVTAGDSAEKAALIPHADLTSTIYQSNYVKIEPAESHTITVTGGSASVEKTTEGETVTITADVPEGQRFVNWTSDQVTFADEAAATTTFTMPDSDVTVTAATASTAQDAPAAAPELENNTTTGITLKAVDPNANGAAAEYGISTDGGETWTWQADPEFTNLTSGTEYTFAVRYGATEDGNYVASSASETVTFSTRRPNAVVPATPAYPPAVEETENGSVDVSPASPKQGEQVTVTPKPDRGYEADGVAVTDKNGNPVKVTDNGDGTYSFTQPSGKVTISVSYVCDGRTDNCPSYHFADVDTSAWYHLAVDFVIEKGLMNGYGDGSFGPNNTLTRAELAQILYNEEKRPAAAGKNVFADVADGAWYADAVTWANQNGIVEGYNGLFAPDDPITREQLAVMLWRYAGSPAAARRELNFTDRSQISDWALEAVLWAAENGILEGYNGILNPKGEATRAETAQMLKNFMENIE